MTDETLADLMRRAGLRPAWQGTREARPGYQQQQSPAGALADPRTLPYRRIPTRRDREFSRASLADTTQRGAYSEPRNQFAEAGMNALETTGAPEIARGVRSIQANEPGQAAGHFALGGLGLLGTASLPFGGGARGAPPRVPRIQPEAPYRLPNAPPRLPTRATDGTILPLRPPEPMRQSLVGGSADLADAARMRPATQLWRGSDTEGTRGGWATPDRQAAAEYGANVRSAGNAPDALEVRDFSDIELAIGDDPAAARALSYLNDSNADVWDALELPEVQSAMRAQGHRAVRLLDDVSPAGRKHESYLFLEPQAQQAGRVPVGRLRPAVQDFPGGQKPVAYTGDNHFFAAEAARAAGARNLDDIGGFVDEAGNYFTREEAASLLGITRRRAGSEDLYPDRTQSDGGPPRPPMFPGGRNR